MNEVEKMYRNAGLSNVWVERYNDGYYEHERYHNSYKGMINRMMKANDWTLTEAQKVAKRECKKEYPPFTAEKQIELIKWLIQKYKDISIEHKLNLFYINIRDIYTGMVHIEFDETIAGLINNLWQSLTDADKAEIKNILESEVRE